MQGGRDRKRDIAQSDRTRVGVESLVRSARTSAAPMTAIFSGRSASRADSVTEMLLRRSQKPFGPP